MKKFAHRSGVSAERRQLTENLSHRKSAGCRHKPPQSPIRKKRHLTPRRKDANEENNLCAFALQSVRIVVRREDFPAHAWRAEKPVLTG